MKAMSSRNCGKDIKRLFHVAKGSELMFSIKRLSRLMRNVSVFPIKPAIKGMNEKLTSMISPISNRLDSGTAIMLARRKKVGN